jgi:hypothetical protein
MKPKYDFEKIKFGTDAPTFAKAAKLYETGGVQNFRDNEMSGFLAEVCGSGGNFYKVFVSARNYDQGDCDCYLGQNDTLCKHMVAVAIKAVLGGKKLSNEDKAPCGEVKCSNNIGKISKTEISAVKKSITDAMRHIKSYNGPSRIWFQYQSSLSEGCARLAKIVSDLPVCLETTQLLIDTLLRLDKKICGGVDDSDGIVGGFIEETAVVLKRYAVLDPKCAEAFEILRGKETCFGWEETLLEILE